MRLGTVLSCAIFLLAATTCTCSGAAVERSAPLFGVPRGGSGNDMNSQRETRQDDYEVAEERIFKAEKDTVHAIEKAIEDEVEIIYGSQQVTHDETNEKDAKKKEKVVVKSAKREEGDNKDDYEEAEKSIFNAVESAEKKALHAAHRAEQAVEHAIEDEVGTLFPPPSEHEKS